MGPGSFGLKRPTFPAALSLVVGAYPSFWSRGATRGTAGKAYFKWKDADRKYTVSISALRGYA